ncbi:MULTISPECIES: alpha/beta fold hydrolase [unclassified Nocardioides]|uniref:alpha/beta fold hydrolase n=1 Tax=unclassified Nocardioides TaxID=2615069 RepID=UPI00138F49C2|nr:MULTISPECIES: alpha/beta hydrolase [unclassified Nocardioides]
MSPHDRRLRHGRVRVVDVGAGPPLVLLHGLGGTWRNWEANIPALARRHRVIAPDLPGFGDSEPYAGRVDAARYVETVVELLDQLDVGTATFVGNSMGGLITMEVAVRHPERVDATVLVCSGGLPLTSARHRLLTLPQARMMNRFLRLHAVRWVVRRSERVRLLLGGRVFHDARSVPPELLGVALRGLAGVGFDAALAAGAGYDARLRAPAIACPTLLLWGREDPLLPVAMGHELHRLIPGSSLEVWDDTGHCPMLEHPARFDERVTAFGEQVRSERPAS